jgi:hypothetical protein
MLEDFLRAWVPLMVSVIALGTAGWNILQGPASKNAATIKGIGERFDTLFAMFDERLDEAEENIQALKATVHELPTKDDFHQLDKGLTEVRGEIKAMVQSQDASKASLARIENVLIGMAGTKP